MYCTIHMLHTASELITGSIGMSRKNHVLRPF
jgi:hypothetical protein